MFCPKCGSQVEDGSRFCESCGAEMPAAAAPILTAGAEPDAAVAAGETVAVESAKSGGMNKAIPIIIVAALLAALVGVGFATNWFGLAGEKGSEASTTGSVSVGQDSSSSSESAQAGDAGSVTPAEGEDATQAAIEDFTVTNEVVDAASADGYKVSGTIASNIGEDCSSVKLYYDVYYLKKDNYGDLVEDYYTSTKYIYDLPAQSSKDFELLFTSPENASNIQRVELWDIEHGEYVYMSSNKTLTADDYALEGLTGEDTSYSVKYTGSIANNTDYKWEWVTVYVTRVYDKDGNVIWSNHGEHDADRDYFNEGNMLQCDASASYVKNGESAEITLELYKDNLAELSKSQIDHFDVRVVATPDNS